MKNGGRRDIERQMGDFWTILNDCDIRDLGYYGIPYTWCNKREGLSSISERLDRFLANFNGVTSFLVPLLFIVLCICGY